MSASTDTGPEVAEFTPAIVAAPPRPWFQPDPTQAPFTGTPVSDIYGNVTYRKKPWP
jgi:hypothetical protein